MVKTTVTTLFRNNVHWLQLFEELIERIINMLMFDVVGKSLVKIATNATMASQYATFRSIPVNCMRHLNIPVNKMAMVGIA